MFKYSTFSEYSLQNILNDELYMNHYESFNDPFECRCEVLTGFPDKESNSPRLKDIIQAWGFEDHSNPAALDEYEDYGLSLEDSQPNVPYSINSARISCFSKRSDNLLMWAHYANGLRGFCLEFDKDLILSENNDDAEIFEVIYEIEPSKIDTAVIAVLNDQIEYNEAAIYETGKRLNFQKLTENENQADREEVQMYEEYLDLVNIKNREIYQKMLATKSVEWRYEEELRIILHTDSTNKAGIFMKYPIESLLSITIGEKMPEPQKQALSNAIKMKSEHIKIKIASRVIGQFNVKIDEID